jgi:phosphatidyl-myo-inositol dimannoside synthase
MTLKNLASASNKIVALFPDLLGLGGIQEASRQTAAAMHHILLRRGWSETFLGLNDPTGDQTLGVGDQRIQFTGMGRSKLRFLLQAIAHADARIVMAAHVNLAVVADIMRFFSPKIKIVVVSHGVEIWERLPIYRRMSLRSADVVLATTSYNAGKLVDLQKVPPAKIRSLPWPLGLRMLDLAESAATLRVPDAFPQGRVILTVGRWMSSERYKGADELIRALADLRGSFPDLSLVLVGSGDDVPRLKQIAADLGLAGATRFLDDVSCEQLAACYSRCEIFALPSWGEGFGLVFLEAMAFGKPLVGARAGGIGDLLKDCVNGILVPPRDIAALVQALDQLLRHQPLRDKLGRRGAEMVRLKYRFDGFERELENILLECGLD